MLLFCRWDESMVPILPEYLRMFYIKLLSNFNEIEDILEPWEKNRMADVQNSVQLVISSLANKFTKKN